MSKLLLSFACAVLLIVNVVSINSKNSLSRKGNGEEDVEDDKQIGHRGMACLHGANGVCGHPAGCKAPGVSTPGHCIGDWTNQCCVMPKKKVYEARNLAKPTYDYDDTPDDLTYCEHLDFCNHHGRCNVDLRECICDDLWYGDTCNRIVNYNTSVGAVTVTILDHFKATKRMDGNEMFLAKAHHRLRQMQALLKKPGLTKDKKLLAERERLIDRLGMRHLLLEQSVHEKIKMDDGAWSTTGATNDTLPVIVTSRLKDISPTDAQIRKVVSSAMKKALISAIKQNKNGKAKELDVEPNPVLKPELTLLNKKNMVELGVKKQIKARDGQARVGVVTGKILRDTSREGHLNEGHIGNDIDDMLSKDIRREHNDEVPGFEITYTKPRNETTKKKVAETKITDDYNKEISKAFNKASFNKAPTPIEKVLETEQQIADREEEARRERDLTMQIDDWNEYPNKRFAKVQNDYLNMKGEKHLSFPNVGDEAPAAHKEFKKVEPKE